jgi:hypothetical protein
MTMTMNRLSRTLDEASRRLRTRSDRLSERREHDEAMRDRGIAQDHAASISRAVADGKPGCTFCS